MKSKKTVFTVIAILIIALIGGLYYFNIKDNPKIVLKEVVPTYQNLKSVISVNGVVEPENRIGINPPVNGRVEKIYVDEGYVVKAGDTLAIMSSTDRAALLDAARSQGAEKVKYWEGVYKPTPLIAPTNGQVIVRNVEPGQTINTATPILVLADKLIVKAQVDETDIGLVKKGQKVVIVLDAYPDISIEGTVKHISYESRIISNVTIYQVEIMPKKVLEMFRSGMSANVEIVEQSKEHVLTISESAISYKNNEPYVLIKDNSKQGYLKKGIKIGLAENGQAEIISGITAKDIIIIKKSNGANSEKASSFFKRPSQRKSKKKK
jgi:membrane fusion protein, macrolide-specific efflux system